MYKLLPILLFAYSLAVTTEDIYDNSYALIIGIDKYKNVRSLDYAVKDANSIASIIKDNFNHPINLSFLKSGTYFISIETEKGMIKKEMIIKI